MTLVLIVIAALAEAGLARRSLQSALNAQQAQQDLIQRWTARSARHFFLDRADEIFWRCEEHFDQRSPSWPAPKTIELAFRIGGAQVRAILSDEDAKTNLNAIHSLQPAKVHSVLVDVSGGLAPKLQPDLSRSAALHKRWYSSWGQVFDLPRVFLDSNWESLMTAVECVTCFGNAKLNIRRASDEALAFAAEGATTRETAQKLVEARREFQGDLLLPNLLAKLALRRSEVLKLRRSLADRSTCYSLWLVLEQEPRTRYHLWVAGDPASESQLLSFLW